MNYNVWNKSLNKWTNFKFGFVGVTDYIDSQLYRNKFHQSRTNPQPLTLEQAEQFLKDIEYFKKQQNYYDYMDGDANDDDWEVRPILCVEDCCNKSKRPRKKK